MSQMLLVCQEMLPPKKLHTKYKWKEKLSQADITIISMLLAGNCGKVGKNDRTLYMCIIASGPDSIFRALSHCHGLGFYPAHEIGFRLYPRYILKPSQTYFKTIFLLLFKICPSEHANSTV